jgi:hypothetical protein
MILRELIKQLNTLANQGYEDLPVLLDDWISEIEEPELVSEAILVEAYWIDDIPDYTSAPKCILIRARNCEDG